MTRPIKFRAQDKMGVWWYFSLHDFINKPDALTDVLENWCEFTGLLDKNDKEIYEGDIVKLQTYWQEEVEYMKSILDIVWHDAGFVLMDKGDFRTILAGENEQCEIIGNIYENLDLYLLKI